MYANFAKPEKISYLVDMLISLISRSTDSPLLFITLVIPYSAVLPMSPSRDEVNFISAINL